MMGINSDHSQKMAASPAIRLSTNEQAFVKIWLFQCGLVSFNSGIKGII